MQTKNIIQASASVIRITNLAVGDIYKRFDTDSYSKDTKYGIVKGVYNDGEKTYVEATEYKKSYRDLEASYFIFNGDKDVSIFPASIEEIKDEFESCLAGIDEKIKEKKEEIEKLESAKETTRQLVSGELQKKIQSPVFKELTQAEFNEKIRQQEAKKLKAGEIDF